METSTLLGLGALAVSMAGAWNSLRKTRIDDRSGTNLALQALNQTYREEIARLEGKVDEMEAKVESTEKVCKDRIRALEQHQASLEQTIIRQANQISELQRRGSSGVKTRASDGGS